MTDQEPAEKALEEHIAMPKGGVAARCQRVKRDGRQCAKPARAGFSICSSHGAGYADREASGARKKPGRPVTTGVYSTQPTRSYAEAQAELASLEDALTSSDRDLIALKAALVMRISELDAHAAVVEEAGRELEALVAEAAAMDPNTVTPEAAMSWVRRLARLRGPLGKLDRLVGQVSDTATKSTTVHKVRAETAAKLAEAEGVGYFLMLLTVQMGIVRTLAPDENVWQAYQMAVQRELLGPNHLELPPLEAELVAE